MQRVEVENTNKSLKIVAFKGKGNEGTMVILNRSLNPVNFKVNWDKVQFTELEKVDPYAPNIIEKFSGKEVMIDPGAFITLTNVPLNK